MACHCSGKSDQIIKSVVIVYYFDKIMKTRNWLEGNVSLAISSLYVSGCWEDYYHRYAYTQAVSSNQIFWTLTDLQGSNSVCLYLTNFPSNHRPLSGCRGPTRQSTWRLILEEYYIPRWIPLFEFDIKLCSFVGNVWPLCRSLLEMFWYGCSRCRWPRSVPLSSHRSSVSITTGEQTWWVSYLCDYWIVFFALGGMIDIILEIVIFRGRWLLVVCSRRSVFDADEASFEKLTLRWRRLLH